jgi:Na+/proline symporter
VIAVDWGIVALYFAVAAAIGVAMSKRGGRSLADYFVSGRALPWWLAGTSMVATTFAADTPLAVTELVVRHGVAGNWLWWNLVMSGILTVFFYARLWRRAGVLTDVEFTEIRYGGKPAAFLRGFRALYLALPVNLIIMGWVNLAMADILGVVLDVPRAWSLGLCLGLTAAYSILSGLWGVVLTDFFQFVLAMTGSILLAFFAVDAVGGLDALRAGLNQSYGSADTALAIFPTGDTTWMPAITLAVYLGVNWWAAWYPGSEPGGGGYVAQRILSCRSERDGVLATLWFNVANFALRPWPWILVALATTILYPGLAHPREGYVRAVVDLLPPGLLGPALLY